MLRCSITSGDTELCLIEIENVGGTSAESDYVVRFIANRGAALGLHSRSIHGFPRTKYNVLALFLQALNTLEEGELSLEPDSATDMARKERGAVREIQSGES